MASYVIQRAERSWGEQRIAVPLEDAQRLAARSDEVFDEGSFPNPGFAADKRDTPAARYRLVKGGRQYLQMMFPFEQ
jgi:hypothetical protein